MPQKSDEIQTGYPPVNMLLSLLQQDKKINGFTVNGETLNIQLSEQQHWALCSLELNTDKSFSANLKSTLNLGEKWENTISIDLNTLSEKIQENRIIEKYDEYMEQKKTLADSSAPKPKPSLR